MFEAVSIAVILLFSSLSGYAPTIPTGTVLSKSEAPNARVFSVDTYQTLANCHEETRKMDGLPAVHFDTYCPGRYANWSSIGVAKGGPYTLPKQATRFVQRKGVWYLQ